MKRANATALSESNPKFLIISAVLIANFERAGTGYFALYRCVAAIDER